jgi:hypothetical protein
MQVKDIKSLETQAEELIKNIALIKKELSKKVTVREQFENETAKIVTSLANVTDEMTNLKHHFGNLSKSEIIKLFKKIDDTNHQLTLLIPEFDQKVDESLSDFAELYAKIEENNNHFGAEFLKGITEITSLKKSMEKYDQTVAQYFNKISLEYTNINTEIASLTSDLEKYNRAVAEYFGKISAEFSTAIQNVEKKIVEQENEATTKMNRIIDQLNESEKRQNKLLERVDSIFAWLETNGEILVTNSRSGLFGRKK